MIEILQNAFVLNKSNVLSLPPKIKALIKKGLPFAFTQRFHNRPSENDIKLTENEDKCIPSNTSAVASKTFPPLLKNKLFRCQPLMQIKIFPSSL